MTRTPKEIITAILANLRQCYEASCEISPQLRGIHDIALVKSTMAQTYEEVIALIEVEAAPILQGDAQ